jgi:hypothetical protein
MKILIHFILFGPPTFFVTFTTSVKKWSILMKTLKDLHTSFFLGKCENNFDNSLIDNFFVRNDLITQ